MGMSDSFKKMMKDPKNQERLSQLGKKAQSAAKDPKTRAQLDKCWATCWLISGWGLVVVGGDDVGVGGGLVGGPVGCVRIVMMR